MSCYYITTYATIALGVDDRVVGLENKPESRPIYQMLPRSCWSRLGRQPEGVQRGGRCALEPDLVIMPLKLQDYAGAWRSWASLC